MHVLVCRLSDKGKVHPLTVHEEPEVDVKLYCFFNFGARWGGWSRERDPAPIVQEAGWARGVVWMDAENLVPTGIRSPDRPACSQSLHRLRYRSPLFGGHRRSSQHVSGELQNAWKFTTMSSHLLPGMVICTCYNKRLTRIRCSINISVFTLYFVLLLVFTNVCTFYCD